MIAVMHESDFRNERFRFVEAKLKAQGIPYKPYGDRQWRGFGQKLQTAAQAASQRTEDHILFMDSRDVIPLAGPDTILKRFKAMGHPWVCAAEPNIWPPNSIKPGAYPTCTSPWRYLNSGLYMAERKYLKECFERWGIPAVGDDDQLWLARRYVQEPGCIQLDVGCELFQCLIGSWWAFRLSKGKLYNKMTDTFPLMLHHNGGGNVMTDERLADLWGK